MLIGCQFSLYPMEKDFVPVILDALEALKSRSDLRVESDDISTFVAGSSEAVFAGLEQLYRRSCRRGNHVVMTAAFSRGCPGEPGDPICTPGGRPIEAEELPAKPQADTGVMLAAQCSLYPLGSQGYMDLIADEISAFDAAGVQVGPKHFCTRLDGDLSRVFFALHCCFVRSGRQNRHVTLHATLSAHSPSRKNKNMTKEYSHE